VCLVGNREDGVDALLAFVSSLRAIYPQAQWVMLNIRDDAGTAFDLKPFDGDSVTLWEASFRDLHPDGGDIETNPLAWHGNTPMWQQALSGIQLRPGAAKVGRSMRKRLFGR